MSGSNTNKSLLEKILASSPCPEIEILEKYRTSRLSGNENHVIECHLVDCEVCSTIVAGLEKNTSTLKMKEIDSNLGQQFNEKIQEGAKTSHLKWFAISAASLAVLFFFVFNDISTKVDLYTQYYRPYPVHKSVLRGSGDKSLLNYSLQIYKSGDYSNALAWLTKSIEQSPNNIKTKFYLANANMAMGDYSNARKIFNSLISAQNSKYVDYVFWYLSLISIKEKKLNEAIGYLHRIEKGDDTLILNKKRLLDALQKTAK